MVATRADTPRLPTGIRTTQGRDARLTAINNIAPQIAPSPQALDKTAIRNWSPTQFDIYARSDTINNDNGTL